MKRTLVAISVASMLVAGLASARAESVPENRCKSPEGVKIMLEMFGDFDAMKRLHIEAVDMENITTQHFDASKMQITCHGTFVLTDGSRLTGTMAIRMNAANDPIVHWTADRHVPAFNSPMQ